LLLCYVDTVSPLWIYLWSVVVLPVVVCSVASTAGFMLGPLGAVAIVMSVGIGGIIARVVCDMFGLMYCFVLAGYVASDPCCIVVCF
jgi:hypothetical protein